MMEWQEIPDFVFEGGPIGPDDEIEKLGRQFEAFRKLHPELEMCFTQYISVYTPRQSNAWAYESNRSKTTLISF